MGCFAQKSNAKPDNSKHSLLYEYSQCKNIHLVTTTPSVAQKVMKFLTEACLRLIEDRQPISDDLLVLCHEYCKDFDVKEAKRLEKVLKDTIRQCLREDIDSRSTEWFKVYIPSSNVLLLDSVLNDRSILAPRAAASTDNVAKFELFRDSNQYQHLTKCLVVAHGLNGKFHSSMKNIVGNMNQENNQCEFKAIYSEVNWRLYIKLLCFECASYFLFYVRQRVDHNSVYHDKGSAIDLVVPL